MLGVASGVLHPAQGCKILVIFISGIGSNCEIANQKKCKSIISIDISGEETAAIHSNGSLKLHLDIVKTNFFLLLMAVTKATIRL